MLPTIRSISTKLRIPSALFSLRTVSVPNAPLDLAYAGSVSAKASVRCYHSKRLWTRVFPSFETRFRPCWRPPDRLAMAWSCPRCTFLNQGGPAVCGMCELEYPELHRGEDTGPEWSCPSCTFLNPFVESACEMCNTARPEGNLGTDESSRLAGKFRPLRAISRDNAMERSPDAADESSDPLRSLIKDTEMYTRKRKAAAVEEEEGLLANERDVVSERAATAEEEVSNRLLGELHAQRMARINKSRAPSGWL
jgi:hypothetical protein